MKIIHAILIVCLLAAMSGCRRVNEVVWADFKDIPAEGWDPIYVMGFDPWPCDSVNRPGDRYDLTLTVRYSARKRQTPLRLIVRQMSEEALISSDTLTLDIIPPAVHPGGNGAYGVFEFSDTVARNLTLPDGYFVELQSLSPPRPDSGLINIGLSLSSTEKTPLSRLISR